MRSLIAFVLLVVLGISSAQADIAGPAIAKTATSPDGNLLVRIAGERLENGGTAFVVQYYEFDEAKDAYIRKSELRLPETIPLGQFLFVSNSGDLAIVCLSEREALHLITKDGKKARGWDLKAFLTPGEIEGCARTGSTIQWLDDGAFFGNRFYFKGPSHRIRALEPPFTLMRGVDPKISFSGTLDSTTAELLKNKADAP
jgi:hypothetical protein